MAGASNAFFVTGASALERASEDTLAGRDLSLTASSMRASSGSRGFSTAGGAGSGGAAFGGSLLGDATSATVRLTGAAFGGSLLGDATSATVLLTGWATRFRDGTRRSCSRGTESDLLDA